MSIFKYFRRQKKENIEKQHIALPEEIKELSLPMTYKIDAALMSTDDLRIKICYSDVNEMTICVNIDSPYRYTIRSYEVDEAYVNEVISRLNKLEQICQENKIPLPY